MLPIFFDTKQLTEDFEMPREEVDALLDIAIKEITLSFARRWEDEAKRTLSSTRNRYINSLSVVDAGRLKGAIVLDYQDPVVRMIEEGAGAFDIKTGMQRSNKRKLKQDGGWYMNIPFRVATPDALAESDVFSFQMDEETYEIAKQLDPKSETRRIITQADLPEHLSKLRTVREGVSNVSTNKTYERYVSKTSPSAGITKTIDEVTGQSRYMKFRTVSDVSDDNAFIHPGINAYNLAQQTESQFESTIDIELNDAINTAFERLGL